MAPCSGLSSSSVPLLVVCKGKPEGKNMFGRVLQEKRRHILPCQPFGCGSKRKPAALFLGGRGRAVPLNSDPGQTLSCGPPPSF